MLSSSKIGTSSWRYYSNSVAKGACEYYAGDGEAPGRWHGRGLSELGLEAGSLVSEQQLEALFARAIHPSTGEALGQRWRADGVTGFDLTFSAPKSVSVLWALGNPGLRLDIDAAHRAAVAAGLGYLDGHAALSRRGTDGAEQVGTAGLVAALFGHRTSRDGDPQLHTHALVLNKLRCADGSWRTIDGHEIYAHKKSAGAVYQAALRAELARRLGVAFEERTPNAQAEIVGVPKNVLDAFGKRTARVSAEAGPVISQYEETLGRELTAAERATVVKTAVLKTRPVKEHTDFATLHERWTAAAAALGWDGRRLSGATGGAGLAAQPPLPDVGEVLDIAVAGAGRRAAAFSRADLLVELAARIPVVPGSADGARRQLEALADAALRREEAVPLGALPLGACPRSSDARYASRELLDAEQRVLTRAQDGDAGAGVVPAGLARTAAEAAGLDTGQTAAVLAATMSGDPVSVWTAPAGAGKTTALGAAAAAWTDAGYRVLGLAPSARAAAELTAATRQPADTLAKWRHEQQRLDRLLPAEAARWRLTGRTVVVLDEAGMASTFDLDALTAAAERAGAKVLLVGDPAQIGVVNGPGGLLAALARQHGAAELGEVHRFTRNWERDASLQLRDGNPAALNAYAARGRIHPADSGDAALDAVFTQWTTARAAAGDALMMARTRADVDRLNARARAAAVASDEVSGPAVEFGGRSWQAGDVLLARRNDRRLPVGDAHVRNGDRYRVLAARDGGLLVQRLGGTQRALLPAEYVSRHADYGWASTIDGAQGATADVGILLARPGLDREHLYVGMTRGRHANHVHVAPEDEALTGEHLAPRGPETTPDARAVLAGALTRSGAQQAAHDVRDAARQASMSLRRSAVPENAGTRPDAVPPALPADRAEPLLDQLAARQRQHAELRRRLMDVSISRLQVSAQLSVTRWWERGRRGRLEERLSGATNEQTSGQAELQRCELDIRRLEAAVKTWADNDARQRTAAAVEERRREQAWRPPKAKPDELFALLAEKVARREHHVAPASTKAAPTPQMATPSPPRRGIRP